MVRRGDAADNNNTPNSKPPQESHELEKTHKEDPITIKEIEDIAKRKLRPEVFNYYACGSDDQLAVRENVEVFDRYVSTPQPFIGPRPYSFCLLLLLLYQFFLPKSSCICQILIHSPFSASRYSRASSAMSPTYPPPPPYSAANTPCPLVLHPRRCRNSLEEKGRLTLRGRLQRRV